MTPPGSPEDHETDCLHRHAPLVYAVLRRVPHPPSLREDLVQEGFIALLEALRAYDVARGPAFSTFAIPRIWGRMRHVTRSGARRFAHESLSGCVRGEVPTDPFDHVDARVFWEQALAALPPSDAILLQQRFEEGWDERRIAHRLLTSQSTVSRRLRRVLLRLHQQLTADAAQSKSMPERD